MYDFIGDVHGYAGKLGMLLQRLGYRLEGGVYKHPDTDRKAVFLGDLIDRGPEIRETVHLVRGMVESGSAFSIMGNHEYNAICFHQLKPSEPHRWMRSRTDKNLYQYLETLYQFKDHRDEWADHLSWFRTLPLWLDLDGVRAVHAAWHAPSMHAISRYTANGPYLSDSLLERGTIRGNIEFDALQNILKGLEMPLPAGKAFTDKDGNPRTEMRIRWWLKAEDRTYGELTFRDLPEIASLRPAPSDAAAFAGYDEDVPVFFGHYWLRSSKPEIFMPTVACLDYSVAAGGVLAAYSWKGESVLTNDHFTFV